jgi:PAS domain S-box-containing protein
VSLYEIVLRREGFADEVRLTDHAGFSVGDAIQVGRHHCLVTSTEESSPDHHVTQRVICTLAVETPLAARLRQQKLLGEALDQFGAAAFVFDAQGVLTAANHAAETITGYSQAELSELDSAELVPHPVDATARVAAVVEGSLRSGRGAIRKKDGTVVAVRFSVDTTTLASGEMSYLSLCWPLA